MNKVEALSLSVMATVAGEQVEVLGSTLAKDFTADNIPPALMKDLATVRQLLEGIDGAFFHLATYGEDGDEVEYISPTTAAPSFG